MDYEKLYKEALERAKMINSVEDVDTSSGTTIYEYIFPELAESENERVRKELVAFLEELSKLGKDTNFDRWKTSDCANWIAWLEKQVSPQMVADAYLRGCDDTEKKWLKKQSEQKPIDYNEELKKCRENPLYFFDKYVYVKLKKQTPAWSEEDDYNLQCMIAKAVKDIQNGEVGRNQELIDWLKSLKERIGG